MSIASIEISNFKSIREARIDLKHFNVLIGANASGKSNFLGVFRFLRDIATEGLSNAISMQGGVEYLRNINIGSSQPFTLRVLCEPNYEYESNYRPHGKTLFVRITKAEFLLQLDFYKTKLDYKPLNEELNRDYQVILEDKKTKERKVLDSGRQLVKKVRGVLTIDSSVPRGVQDYSSRIRPSNLFYNYTGRRRHEVLCEDSLLEYYFAQITPFDRPFVDINMYDLDPRLSKHAVPISSRVKLEEDGRNLALVINNLLKDKSSEAKLSNLLNDFLPFIEGMNIFKIADKSMLFQCQERYFKERYLPASVISDGTIQVLALICALYFERMRRREPLSIKIIEEPERNIHPFLISKVISMMKDVSKNTQIIVTTHNPEILKYVDLENILLIKRDEEGYSSIFRPDQSEKIKTFLESDIGVDELYVKNLLESLS